MFAPNVVPDFSHREEQFHKIYKETEYLFKKLARLNTTTDKVVFVSGSGTLANEIILWSLNNPCTVKTDGEFSTRLKKSQSVYKQDSYRYDSTFGVLYETGESKFCSETEKCDIADAVSAFPYYIPSNKVWTTVSSKQLGAMTGISIIVIRNYKDTMKLFKEEEHCYLSLAKYVNKSVKYETPNTPSIDALVSLRDTLRSFDLTGFRKKINDRYFKIRNLCQDVGLKLIETSDADYLVNHPVITLGHLDPELVKKYRIYTNGGRPQLFLWAGSDYEYECFVDDVRGFYKRKTT